MAAEKVASAPLNFDDSQGLVRFMRGQTLSTTRTGSIRISWTIFGPSS